MAALLQHSQRSASIIGLLDVMEAERVQQCTEQLALKGAVLDNQNLPLSYDLREVIQPVRYQ